MTLEPEDIRHINAAHGYCELKMYRDATEELGMVSEQCRDLPEVAGARLSIYQGLKDWESMRDMAMELTRNDPANPQWWVSWAYATRRAKSIEAAKTILLEAVKLHAKQPLLHYNLACYECQLGDLELATIYLKRAFRLEPKYRVMAAEDEDLIPLKEMIRGD